MCSLQHTPEVWVLVVGFFAFFSVVSAGFCLDARGRLDWEGWECMLVMNLRTTRAYIGLMFLRVAVSAQVSSHLGCP